MTRLYIDRHEVPPPVPAAGSLDQVLNYVETRHISPHKVIRRVHIDGTPLMPEDLHGDSTVLGHTCRGKTIEIFTGSIREIALDSIHEAVDFLARMEDVTLTLARKFRRQPDREALFQLKQYYEGFYWLNLLVDRLCTSFKVALDKVEAGGASAAEIHAGLISALKPPIDSHKGDTTQIADHLEFSIFPILPRCRQMFLGIEREISAAK